ncbi:GM15449 [Drosophila sechellia]|uniref:GM15449 n=1 Tax=Drosophila sechellia TaxID=7238 RepID=B4IBY8_DROSE|nr:GM15449 [Drosophila sechellia]
MLAIILGLADCLPACLAGWLMMMIFELRSLAMLLEVEFYCHTNITQAVSSGNSNQAQQQQHKSQSPSSVRCFLPTSNIYSNTSAAITTTAASSSSILRFDSNSFQLALAAD